jgi:hypothetical protein
MMATNLTGTQQARISGAIQAALAKETSARRMDYSPAAKPEDSPRRASGYGLPCSKCHLYYSADLDVCPTCKHNERVPAVVAQVPLRPVQAAAEPVHDSAEVEQEREEFLRQFKAQLLEAHAQAVNAPEAVCRFGERHEGETASADVCTNCYERLQERVDVMEAALHIELKEAAQIVYDAVWADPSDPGKTYENAASALLAELRRRAGVSSVFGPFQPLTH